MQGKVYILRMSETNYFKIGYTANSVKARVRSLQTGAPRKLAVYAVCELGDAWLLERRMHQDLFDCKTDGGEEWFELEPANLDAYLERLEKEYDREWFTRCDTATDQVKGLYSNYVRQVPRRQRDKASSGGEDVLLARHPSSVLAQGERFIVPERQELNILRQDDWRSRLQKLRQRALGLRDD